VAYSDLAFYCNSVGYAAVPAWAATTAIAAGALRRQLAAPAVNNERVFVCIVAGTTGGAEPTWALTRGATTVDGTVTWMEVTGVAAVNGDSVNTYTWNAIKALAAGNPSLGVIIQRNSGTSYQICTTSGTYGTGGEPAFSDTAGVVTPTNGTSVWTSLGPVGNFTGGGAPHARLAAACATNWFAGGNTIYVGDNHAESQTTNLTISPASANPLVGRIICNNHSGNYPPAAGDITTGAVISTTAAVNITISGGSIYFYGLTFKAAVGVSSSYGLIIIQPAAACLNIFDNCSFWLASTAAANIASLQTNSAANFSSVVFNNVTVRFAVTSNYVAPGDGLFTWQNTGQVLASGSAVPTTLLNFGVAASFTQINHVLEGLDLSQLTGNLYGFNTTNHVGSLLVKDCKLNASMSVIQPAAPGFTVQFVRSDSGATGYKSARYAYEGTETTETSITRVGGASDPTGQAQSRKLATTTNSQWLRPFKVEPYAIWNPTTGANVTVTVYGTINAGALPNNDDIWLEVEYLGSALFPLGTIVNTTKANVLTANAAVASDGSTWNGGGSGTGWLPFKLVATLAAPQPGMAGVIEARVRAAKPSTTYYLDPQPVLS
jgi:hypothetical protein